MWRTGAALPRGRIGPPRPFRAAVTPRATPQQPDAPPLDDAVGALVAAALSGDVDSALLDCLPDAPFAAAADRWEEGQGSEASTLTFLDVVRHAGADLHFDAYALRALILAPPRSLTATAALRVTPTTALVRAAAVASAGEEVALELSLVLEERAAAHYRGVRAVQRWALAGARGEPGAGEGGSGDGAQPRLPPSSLHPRHGPEAVLEGALAALASRDGAAASSLMEGAPAGSAPARLAAAAPRGGETPPPGLDLLLAPGMVADILSTRMLAPDACLAVVGVSCPAEAAAAPDGAPPTPSRRAALVWRLGLRPALDGNACWCVEGVELAGGWAADGGGAAGFPWPVGG